MRVGCLDQPGGLGAGDGPGALVLADALALAGEPGVSGGYVSRFEWHAPVCRHDHRAKQAPGWALTQTQPGHMTWTTPSGRTYTTGPTSYPD